MNREERKRRIVNSCWSIVDLGEAIDKAYEEGIKEGKRLAVEKFPYMDTMIQKNENSKVTYKKLEYYEDWRREMLS